MTARKSSSCNLNPNMSDFKFLVLFTVSHNKQGLKHALQAQKIFLLRQGFYLLPKANFCLAFSWIPINH